MGQTLEQFNNYIKGVKLGVSKMRTQFPALGVSAPSPTRYLVNPGQGYVTRPAGTFVSVSVTAPADLSWTTAPYKKKDGTEVAAASGTTEDAGKTIALQGDRVERFSLEQETAVITHFAKRDTDYIATKPVKTVGVAATDTTAEIIAETDVAYAARIKTWEGQKPKPVPFDVYVLDLVLEAGQPVSWTGFEVKE